MSVHLQYLPGNQMDSLLTNMIHWSQHNPTKPPSPLWSSQVSCLTHTKQSPVSCQSCQYWTNTATHTFRKDVQAPSHLSDVCTVRDNEEDKTHHINYPANAFFRGPVNHCAKTFLRTSAIPLGAPRHSWVLNLGSLRIACQQPLLRGEKDRERVCVREEKWGEGRGEAGARGE